jgi:hypothetical protein
MIIGAGRLARALCFCLFSATLPATGWVGDSPPLEPVVDAHLHYKWNQAEVTSPEQAVAALRENRVELAVVAGTPPELALKLHELAPDLIVPIFGPYRTSGEWYSWQGRQELVDEARKALERGPYRGIGELHLIGGFALRWERNRVLTGLLDLGVSHRVPLLVHMEFSRAEPTLSLCQGNPENRFILAHAGGVLPPAEVERILDGCPNLWVDLSARDPWRYVRNPIAKEDGGLLPDWESLVLGHPERFLIGSDAVWPVEQMDAWDQADSGWEHLGEFLDFHRRWASSLPAEVRAKVLRDNARRLFARGQGSAFP